MLRVEHARWDQTPADLRELAMSASHPRTRERFLALYEITQASCATRVAERTRRHPQTVQGGADRLAAAGPAEPLTHPADQTAQRPARRWIGTGYGRGCGGGLGGRDGLAMAGFDLWAKEGRPPVRR